MQDMDLYGRIVIDILIMLLMAAIIVLAVYLMIKKMLPALVAARAVSQPPPSNIAVVLPLRLQAYERLALFCERIALPALLFRHQSDETVNVLRLTLLLAIQQEYEHNISQQIYVSDQLWQIVKAARDDSSQFVDVVATQLDGNASAQELTKALYRALGQRQSDPISIAQLAIRREVASLF